MSDNLMSDREIIECQNRIIVSQKEIINRANIEMGKFTEQVKILEEIVGSIAIQSTRRGYPTAIEWVSIVNASGEYFRNKDKVSKSDTKEVGE
jgi:hypothetical protein